jgi:hypothetical protein
MPDPSSMVHHKAHPKHIDGIDERPVLGMEFPNYYTPTNFPCICSAMTGKNRSSGGRRKTLKRPLYGFRSSGLLHSTAMFKSFSCGWPKCRSIKYDFEFENIPIGYQALKLTEG